ncbi:hypothetical protein BH11MYX2_BH11MYX2_07360 [soil metagenome]
MSETSRVLGGKYRLDRRLGGGGMAEVFGASTKGAEGFERRVAIKRVLPGYSDNPEFARMFIAEAKISSRLQHPNIVSVLDFDRDADQRLYLVMELVDGKDLDALASTGPLPFGVAIFVIAETLRGLGHAHDLPIATDFHLHGSTTMRAMKGVVHRDISPHNVLLSWEGMVKVSDFGIAKARTATSATGTEMLKGKPAYMSPEQANGEQLDGRSDLFAVGVMLWELLCGARLFAADDTRAMLAAVMFKPIRRPRTIRTDLPKDLERVVMKLLERDVSARYTTAEAALAALLACTTNPRDGRADLQRLLAERFPADAPVRHSAVRPRSPTQTPSSQPHPGLPVYAQPTILFEAPVQAAPTRLDRPRSGRGAVIGFGLLGAVFVAIVIVAAVSSQRGPERRQSEVGGISTRPDSASPDDAAAAIASSASSSDAAISAPLPDASSAPLSDAAPPAPNIVTRPPADAHDLTTERTPPRVSAKGRLRVQAFPALTVYVDGRRLHDTPVDQQLAPGKHMLRLVNSEIGKDERVPVVIKENATTLITRE